MKNAKNWIWVVAVAGLSGLYGFTFIEPASQQSQSILQQKIDAVASGQLEKPHPLTEEEKSQLKPEEIVTYNDILVGFESGALKRDKDGKLIFDPEIKMPDITQDLTKLLPCSIEDTTDAQTQQAPAQAATR